MPDDEARERDEGGAEIGRQAVAVAGEVRRVICTTPSKASTPATGGRSAPEVISRPGSPPSNASTWHQITRPTGRGRARWVMRWKPALNAFAVTFEGRIDPTTN